MTPLNANPNVERLALDAAALVRVASPNDWPGGFVVVPERLPGRIVALAVGAGAGLAAAYGYREGRRGVLVDFTKTVGNLDAPTLADVALVECAALHEAAHTLTVADVPTSRAAELLATAGASVADYTAQQIARQHCPRWAMALWLLVTRGSRYRPRTGAAMVEHIGQELELYGFPSGDLERLAAGVGHEEPLAERLAVGGAWQSLLVARLPDESTRAAAIVAAGVRAG